MSDSARIEACARSPFKNLRLYALEKLLQDDHPSRDAILLELIRDREPAVTAEAVRVAGILQCDAALPGLLELLHSGDELVAVQAAVSLGEIGYYGDVAPEALEPEPVSSPPTVGAPQALDTVTFYILFVLFSAGLFFSGYLFRSQMDPGVPPAAHSDGNLP